MKRLFFLVLLNALALWIADLFVPGFTVIGGMGTYAVAGLVLGLLNAIGKPILKLVTLPLMVVTLGLFSLVINALLLWAVTVIVPSVIVAGLIPLVWATLVVTASNIVTNRLT
jgi:putative membrane protein